MFVLAKIVDQTFFFKEKIKSESLAWTATIMAVLSALLLSMILVFLVTRLVFNLPAFLGFIENQTNNISVAKNDCPVILDTIYETENAVYSYENHRYIEQTSSMFDINSDYKKGAKKLREQILKYQNLKLQNSSRKDIDLIVNTLKVKAELFEKRVNISPYNSETDNVSGILAEMDKVTKERLKLVDALKSECVANKIR